MQGRKPATKASMAALNGAVIIATNDKGQVHSIVLTPELARQLSKQLPSMAALADSITENPNAVFDLRPQNSQNKLLL